MAGTRLSTGFVSEDAPVGIAAEFGDMKITAEPDAPGTELRLRSAYGMIGPAIRSAFGAAPLVSLGRTSGGTSEDSGTDLVSLARAVVTWGIGNRARLGLTLGSFYLHLHASDGLIEKRDAFTVILGAETGLAL